MLKKWESIKYVQLKTASEYIKDIFTSNPIHIDDNSLYQPIHTSQHPFDYMRLINLMEGWSSKPDKHETFHLNDWLSESNLHEFGPILRKYKMTSRRRLLLHAPEMRDFLLDPDV